MRNDMFKNGFTLLELAVVMAAAAIVSGAVLPSFVKSMYIDAAHRSALEVAQIEEAARSYLVKLKSWPADIPALQSEGYLDNAWSGNNAFGKPYSLEISGQVLLVKTEVPKDVASVLAGALPMTSINGGIVVSAVTNPGIDAGRLPVGAVIPWPGIDVPSGWNLCDGRSVVRSDHQELFALLGTIYGEGDGSTTFNLPDLRGRVVVGLDNMGGSVANNIVNPLAKQLGGRFGEENHTLTIDEMPAHTHGVPKQIPGSWGDSMSHSDWYPSEYRWGQLSSSTGGNLPHNIVQPSMAMNWVIKG